MLTLYTFGRAFGLPDGSPFVTKAETLLRMAGLPYQSNSQGMFKAPKGKLPYINDGGTVLADSTLIRFHLEQRHGIDFDAGYGGEALAMAWAVEKMLEEHLYFATLHARWVRDDNFERGPRHFFDAIPLPLRPLVRWLVRRKLIKSLHAQGMGRHGEADIITLANRDLDAVSTLLGDKPYLLGERPCGADATVFAFIGGALCPVFETPIRRHAESLPNLVAYRDRMLARFYPELVRGGASG
ncbi:glutathione S-transferase family protein [Chitinimonas sp.]|uniref:glutathione S-transferase family protein n=1 Tax=Chitinimonas sp. TaxID=1934313 RepID=UPI0035B38BCF